MPVDANYKPTLYLIRGVSGSGKSTLAARMKECGLVDFVLEADELFIQNGEYKFDAAKLGMAHQACQFATLCRLTSGKNVVVSNTTTKESDVKIYQDIATSAEANFVSIIVENRNGTKSIHNVPEQTLERQRKQFSIRL